MIFEFIWNKKLIDLRKEFLNASVTEYHKLQKVNERKNRKKKGILVAELIVINKIPTVCIGWSLCNLGTKKKPKDKFDIKMGFKIAMGRAVNYGNEQIGMNIITDIPPSIKKQLKLFIVRASKYYHVADNHGDILYPSWVRPFMEKN